VNALAPERMPTVVATVTTVAGIGLIAAPEKTAALLGLEGQDTGLRLVGLADLVLVPGLAGASPRWPWMIGRAALNVGQAAYFAGVAPTSEKPGSVKATAIGLLALTLVDGLTGLTLKRRSV
jgi:hypothetical protein